MPKKIIDAWRDVFKFYFNYFSIPLLVKTFFSPWRNYLWSYGKGFDLGRYIEVLFSNLTSRIIGAILRSGLIILGLAVEFFVVLVGIIILLAWLFFPWFLISLLIFGISILF